MASGFFFIIVNIDVFNSLGARLSMVELESIVYSMLWESFLREIEGDKIWRGVSEILGILFDSLFAYERIASSFSSVDPTKCPNCQFCYLQIEVSRFFENSRVFKLM